MAKYLTRFSNFEETANKLHKLMDNDWKKMVLIYVAYFIRLIYHFKVFCIKMKSKTPRTNLCYPCALNYI